MLANVDGIGNLILIIYLLAHLPAFIVGGIGLSYLKSKPKKAKTLLIIAGVYLVIGTGICGSLLYAG